MDKSDLVAKYLLFCFLCLILPPSILSGERPRVDQPRPKRVPPKNAADKPKTKNDDTKSPSPPKEDNPPKDDVLDKYAELAASFANRDLEKKEIFYYQCKHIRSESLSRILEGFITSSGTVAHSSESDMVVVSDVISHVKQLKEIAKNVDIRVPQVLVEAQIVELTLDSDFEKEINLNLQHISPNGTGFIKELIANMTTPGANPTAGQGLNATFRPYYKSYQSGTSNTLTSFIRYLETKGKATLLSAPNIILRRGAEGMIRTGEEVPILEQTTVSGSVTTSTKFKNVGITLKVQPLMVNNDVVRLTVSPEVSAVTGFTSAGASGVSNPIIAVRSATTELEVKDGELISIGGLLRNEERTVKSRVPIAGSLPILGHLFRGTRVENVKTHLVIFLKITILAEGKPGGVVIHRPASIPEPVKEEIDDLEKNSKRPKADIYYDLKTIGKDGQD